MNASGVGFFGKLPTLGDFVSRGLSREFIEPWDQWLQSAVRTSQDVHGDNWLSLFLVSPFWRFALSPGICGNHAWAGVLMPSVDRVGRYYPLTLAQAIETNQLATLFLPETGWFEQLEDAAMMVLDEPFDMTLFEQHLQRIAAPRLMTGLQAPGAADGKAQWRYQMASLADSGQAFALLQQRQWQRDLSTFSLWACELADQQCAELQCFTGFPPLQTYADFLASAANQVAMTQFEPNLNPNPEPNPVFPAMRPLLDPAEGDEPTIPNASATDEDWANAPWSSHGVTVVGNRRKHNEDAMLDAPQLGLWVVADGMGGHQSGDLASQRVVGELVGLPVTRDLQGQVDWICQRLQQVNRDLCRIAEQMQPGAVIGTTVVCLLANGNQCAAIWAGDSRLYRWRKAEFEQLTRDHTLLDELVSAGGQSREQLSQHIGANVITRAVGGQDELQLDVIGFLAEPGDRFMLCSDGLDKELSPEEIAVGVERGDCRQAAEGLIATALSRSGIDNITVVVVDFHGLL